MTQKIAILTQPLHVNFGGTLQAFALQKVLKHMGYDVETINYRSKEVSDFRKLLSAFKQILKCQNIFQFNSRQLKEIQAQHKKFISSYIDLSVEINNVDKLRAYFFNKKFDAVVVGSDQVWRGDYSPRIESYFLDFLYEDKSIKKISYAASFGSNEWNFSQTLTKILTEYINDFDSVSVREESAVNLCKENLTVLADHVLDPTLLLNREDYINLFNDEKTENTGEIFSYILDEDENKNKLIQRVSNYMGGKKIFTKQPLKKNKIFITNISKYQYPSIESWLKSFYDADFIVTDSFHGTVFSIIFNKPFISIKNTERGNSRFESLLKIFELEDRLIDVNESCVEDIIGKEINYAEINLKLIELREYSKAWLLNSLKG